MSKTAVDSAEPAQNYPPLWVLDGVYHKGFCTKLLDHSEKVHACRSLQGYWNPQRKTGVLSHIFSGYLTLNLNKNVDISIFLKKEGKDISSQIFLEIYLLLHTNNQTHL